VPVSQANRLQIGSGARVEGGLETVSRPEFSASVMAMSVADHSSVDMVVLAWGVAVGAHVGKGQTDKAGEPYLGHVERVAARVERYGPNFVAVALLHDVIEDTCLTANDLLNAGFPTDVVDGVESLTKREGEEHHVAVARAAADRYGRVVKAADVADNSDPDRLSVLEKDLAHRLRVKYRRAREVLDRYDAPVFD
jgi:hypothetical protein